MTRRLAAACTIGLAARAPRAAAQNLVVTNARILDGTGRVIESGSSERRSPTSCGRSNWCSRQRTRHDCDQKRGRLGHEAISLARWKRARSSTW